MKRLTPLLLLLVILLFGCRSEDVSSSEAPPIKTLEAMALSKEEAAMITRVRKEGVTEHFSVEPVDLKNAKKVGLIVPHHLVAAKAIQNALDAISDFEPEVIVLLAPNHKPSDAKPILTRKEPFKALNKAFDIAPETLSLLDEKVAAESSERFLTEHGLYSVLPFIGQYFDAPILPLVFAPGLDKSRMDALHKKMAPLLSPKKVLWIASIDFSHYLPAAVSLKKDEQTAAWIETRNFEALYSASNAHYDSPEVLRLWLLQFENTKRLWHSNSALLTGSGFNEEGTSYMVYLGY